MAGAATGGRTPTRRDHRTGDRAAPTAPRHLAGVPDPGTLFTEPQRAEIGLTSAPLLTEALSGVFNGDIELCTARGYQAPGSRDRGAVGEPEPRR